jgi:hypothetical protein
LRRRFGAIIVGQEGDGHAGDQSRDDGNGDESGDEKRRF